MKDTRKALAWCIVGMAGLLVAIAAVNITLLLVMLMAWNIVFIRMMVMDMLD